MLQGVFGEVEGLTKIKLLYGNFMLALLILFSKGGILLGVLVANRCKITENS